VSTGKEAEAAGATITVQLRNYGSAKPVSGQLFRAYKDQYSYDKTPLHAKVESVQETEDWRQEKVSFDAAYGGERVTAYLFLPKGAVDFRVHIGLHNQPFGFYSIAWTRG
jgi:hypothetical protein